MAVGAIGQWVTEILAARKRWKRQQLLVQVPSHMRATVKALVEKAWKKGARHAPRNRNAWGHP